MILDRVRHSDSESPNRGPIPTQSTSLRRRKRNTPQMTGTAKIYFLLELGPPPTGQTAGERVVARFRGKESAGMKHPLTRNHGRRQTLSKFMMIP